LKYYAVCVWIAPLAPVVIQQGLDLPTFFSESIYKQVIFVVFSWTEFHELVMAIGTFNAFDGGTVGVTNKGGGVLWLQQ
jgi:hypothetical protein